MDMNVYIETFLSWPLVGRVACLVFPVIVLLWGLFGKYLLHLLSVIPFLLDNIFRGIYIIIEFPISALHRKCGGGFYNVENFVTNVAEKVDSLLLRWYTSWKHINKITMMPVMLIYIAAVVFIGVVPVLANWPDAPISMGGRAYIQCENKLVSWMESKGWYTSPETIIHESLFLQVDNNKILKYGQPQKINSMPILQDGQLYLPVRDVVESLGGTVRWNKQDQQVIIQLGKKEIKMSTSSSTAYINGNEQSLLDSDLLIQVDTKMYISVQTFSRLFDYYFYCYEKDNLLAVSATVNCKAGVLTLEAVYEKMVS